jgi:RNA polymerase sigma factor (sigma-70 family)
MLGGGIYGHLQRRVYRRHVQDLTRFATSLVGPPDAGDVVAEAVMRVMWSNRWDEVRDHRACLYRAVLNEARMLARSSARRRTREARVAVAVVGPEIEFRPDVADAVARLSVRQRAAVFLTYWEGLPQDEVAGRLGISVGSVKRHLSRARDKLKDLIEE